MASGQHGDDVGDGIMGGMTGCGCMAGIVQEQVSPRVNGRKARAGLKVASMWNRITEEEGSGRVNCCVGELKGAGEREMSQGAMTQGVTIVAERWSDVGGAGSRRAGVLRDLGKAICIISVEAGDKGVFIRLLHASCDDMLGPGVLLRCGD